MQQLIFNDLEESNGNHKMIQKINKQSLPDSRCYRPAWSKKSTESTNDIFLHIEPESLIFLMSAVLGVWDNQLCFTIQSEQFTTMRYPRKASLE